MSGFRGSSSVTANASGVKTASALYKAFGETRYTLGALGTDYKFTGQREQAELGLYFYGARWFDPSLGRFTQPDTIVPTGTQGTQAWDRYAYVNNNPVRYNDPTGHFVNILIGMAIGAVVGGAIAAAVSYAQTGSVNWNAVGAAALGGAIVGGIVATGIGLLAAPALTTTGLATAGAELAGAAETANIAIATDFGTAVQDSSAEAMALRETVQGGAPLYRIGTLGQSAGAEAQFWSTENPFLDPQGFASGYGVPPANVANWNFGLIGRLLPNANFVTRLAPGVETNAGGALEVVTEKCAVEINCLIMQ